MTIEEARTLPPFLEEKLRTNANELWDSTETLLRRESQYDTFAFLMPMIKRMYVEGYLCGAKDMYAAAQLMRTP